MTIIEGFKNYSIDEEGRLYSYRTKKYLLLDKGVAWRAVNDTGKRKTLTRTKLMDKYYPHVRIRSEPSTVKKIRKTRKTRKTKKTKIITEKINIKVIYPTKIKEIIKPKYIMKPWF